MGLHRLQQLACESAHDHSHGPWSSRSRSGTLFIEQILSCCLVVQNRKRHETQLSIMLREEEEEEEDDVV